jgi:hypothetical protein
VSNAHPTKITEDAAKEFCPFLLTQYAAEKVDGILEGDNKGVNFFPRIVKIQTRPCCTRYT